MTPQYCIIEIAICTQTGGMESYKKYFAKVIQFIQDKNNPVVKQTVTAVIKNFTDLKLYLMAEVVIRITDQDGEQTVIGGVYPYNPCVITTSETDREITRVEFVRFVKPEEAI